jgi:hypothetical protein
MDDPPERAAPSSSTSSAGLLLTVQELKDFKVVPLQADEHNILFGITNNTSQQTMQTIRGRFLDQRVSFSLISDNGFLEYMKLYNPPEKIEYQDVKFSDQQNDTLISEVTATLDRVLADDILAYLVKQTYQL